jgi:hypothetical protein
MFRQIEQKLLGFGANVWLPDRSGRSPLTAVLAAKAFPDRVSWILKMLDGRANPNMLDGSREVIQSPINIAIHTRWEGEVWDGKGMTSSPARVQVVDLLLRAGAKPNTFSLLPYLNRMKETPDFFKFAESV